MSRIVFIAALVSAWLTAWGTTLMGQPPEGRDAERDRPRVRDRQPDQRPDQPGPRLLQVPLLRALDANGDGEIGSDEIDNAANALKSLDRNGDGKLTRNEILPSGFGRFGPQAGRRSGPGGPLSDRPAPDRPPRPDRAGADDRPGPPDQPPDEARGQRIRQFIQRVLARDKDGDGKLSRDELPERLLRIMDRADRNDDGYLDRQELRQIAQPIMGGQPDQPDQPRRPDPPEDRPDRPDRPSDEDRPNDESR